MSKMQTGEKYRCPEERCGCEVTVTKGPTEESQGAGESMRCCCGALMEKVVL